MHVQEEEERRGQEREEERNRGKEDTQVGHFDFFSLKKSVKKSSFMFQLRGSKQI